MILSNTHTQTHCDEIPRYACGTKVQFFSENI